RLTASAFRQAQLRLRQARVGCLQQVEQLRIRRCVFEQTFDGAIDIEHRKAVGDGPASRQESQLFAREILEFDVARLRQAGERIDTLLLQCRVIRIENGTAKHQQEKLRVFNGEQDIGAC